MTLTDADRERRKASAAIFSAAAEGKVIEWLHGDNWEVCDPFNDQCGTTRNVIKYPKFYRLQPAPVVRPWTPEEMIGQRVKSKTGGGVYLITGVYGEHCEIGKSTYLLENVQKYFTQLDGTPCGQTPA